MLGGQYIAEAEMLKNQCANVWHIILIYREKV